MKTQLLLASIVLLFITASAVAQTKTFRFETDKVGKAPQGFSTALTGRGKPGVWTVMKDDSSPEQKNVLAQTDADATGYRFPICVFDAVALKDLDLSVKFKPISGMKDQAAGLV